MKTLAQIFNLFTRPASAHPTSAGEKCPDCDSYLSVALFGFCSTCNGAGMTSSAAPVKASA